MKRPYEINGVVDGINGTGVEAKKPVPFSEIDDRLMLSRNPSYAARTMPTELICKYPRIALMYALDRLTDDQIEKCIHADPACGLERAFERLSPQQFDFCVRAEPVMALKSHVAQLSPEQYDFCIRLADSGAV